MLELSALKPSGYLAPGRHGGALRIRVEGTGMACSDDVSVTSKLRAA